MAHSYWKSLLRRPRSQLSNLSTPLRRLVEPLSRLVPTFYFGRGVRGYGEIAYVRHAAPAKCSANFCAGCWQSRRT